MFLTDVNILVAAYRREHAEHARCRTFVRAMIRGPDEYGVSDLVLSGFVRVVTNPRASAQPARIEQALEYAGELLWQSNARRVQPGPLHWSIFRRLCRETNAKGNLVPDAFFAAMAIESDCEWVTMDRDFAKFRGLRWSMPPMVGLEDVPPLTIHQAAPAQHG